MIWISWNEKWHVRRDGTARTLCNRLPPLAHQLWESFSPGAASIWPLVRCRQCELVMEKETKPKGESHGKRNDSAGSRPASRAIHGDPDARGGAPDQSRGHAGRTRPKREAVGRGDEGGADAGRTEARHRGRLQQPDQEAKGRGRGGV